MTFPFEVDAEVAARVAHTRLDDATAGARAAIQSVRDSAEVDWVSDQYTAYRAELWHALEDLHRMMGRIEEARERVGAWLRSERDAQSSV